MSRSGYVDDCDDTLAMGRWRAQVASAMRGKRGQALLRDLLKALDEMPVKRLIAHELKSKDGEFCTLGVLGEKRGIPMEFIDPENSEDVANHFDIAHQMAAEIVYTNDEYFDECTPEERWVKMRDWVASKLEGYRAALEGK